MRAELRDSLEFLYDDSAIGTTPCLAMTLDVARGGMAAVHVLLNHLSPGKTLRCHVVEAEGQWFRLLDVPVEENTGLDGFTERDGVENPFVARRAPFRVFDAMQPLCVGACAIEPVEVDNPTMALRLHLPIAPDAPAGETPHHLVIDAGGEPAHLALTVRVHAVEIPTVGIGSFPYTNWFSIALMAERHDLEPWGEAHWQMIAQYAALMAHGRQNTFWVPQGDIFGLIDGKPVLNRERLRRLVQVFTDAGMHYIEGGHFGARTTEDWHCPTFSLTVTQSLATSVQGNADIAAIAKQLMEEIETHRSGYSWGDCWRDRWLQHIADEPIADNAADYRIFTGMVRKYMPGIPIIDATMYEGLVGSVNIWCPQAQEYQRHQAQFAAQRAVGDKVWFYTCCYPGGPWLNRLLDMELIRPALFGWAAAHFRLNGFLHWGLNHYRPDQDPFQQSVVGHGGAMKLPAGDTHIVYPGADGPWSSVRLEAQREGFEDNELLHRLDPAQAQTIIAPILRGFDDYTKDVTVLREARRRLYEQVVEKQRAWEEKCAARAIETKPAEEPEGVQSTAIFLSELRRVLQVLALPHALHQQWQSHFKPRPDGLPQPEFRHFHEYAQLRPDITLTEAQRTALDAVKTSIELHRNQANALSTMDATDASEHLRQAAIAALDAFGWPAEMPPLPRYVTPGAGWDDGMRRLWEIYRDLHVMRHRPGIFLGETTVGIARAYFEGMKHIFHLLTLSERLPSGWPSFQQAETDHGWHRHGGMATAHWLLNQGWSELVVVDEMIAMKIDAVAMMLEALEKAWE